MMAPTRPRVFFACDTNSRAFTSLRSGLETLLVEFDLELFVFDREKEQQGAILEKVERQIESSICVLADVGCDSSRPVNGNVMLEVGIARGLDRPTLYFLADPATAPANLQGRDFVRYPACLQVGTADYVALHGFLAAIGRGLLGGRDLRIFSSRSREYLEVLRSINELAGREWYVGPELRAFLRPQDAGNRWLRDFRKVSPALMQAELDLRRSRRNAFENNLAHHRCTDVYPRSAFDLDKWRGMLLTADEKVGFLTEALRLLRSLETYEMVIVDGEDRQKYWIKEAKVGAFVVFEGWGHVDITTDRATGGLIMTDPEVVASFRAETNRLIDSASLGRDGVTRLIETLLHDHG